jgi:hypothetical protein
MKRDNRLVATFVIFALMFCSGCAGSSAYMKSTKTLLQPTQNKALVRFMRPSGYGFAINFNMLDGDHVIGNSVAMSQFGYLAEPGRHLFIATAENKVFLEADLEAGKTYYIITRVYMGAWSARVAFVAVTKGSEYWDKVRDWETSLKIIEPSEVVLKNWEDAHKVKINGLVSQYETKWKTTYQWPVLRPEDGR